MIFILYHSYYFFSKTGSVSSTLNEDETPKSKQYMLNMSQTLIHCLLYTCYRFKLFLTICKLSKTHQPINGNHIIFYYLKTLTNKSFFNFYIPTLHFVYPLVYLCQSCLRRLNVCASDKTGNLFKTIMPKTLLDQLNLTMCKQIVSHNSYYKVV